MAFELFAFDLFAAPRDRYDFLDWISRNFRTSDGPLSSDASRLTPALQAWHREVSKSFPGPSDPHRFDPERPQAVRNASYSFTQNAVLASFDWDNSGPALYRAKRAAQAHGVGFFEACSHDDAVWMISPRGRWEIVHRNEEHAHG